MRNRYLTPFLILLAGSLAFATAPVVKKIPSTGKTSINGTVSAFPALGLHSSGAYVPLRSTSVGEAEYAASDSPLALISTQKVNPRSGAVTIDTGDGKKVFGAPLLGMDSDGNLVPLSVDGDGRMITTGNGGPGTGDVSGPASSTANHIAIYSGTGGKTLKDTVATTATELGYVAGVTGAVQTQLNNKISSTADVTLNHSFTVDATANNTAGFLVSSDRSAGAFDPITVTDVNDGIMFNVSLDGNVTNHGSITATANITGATLNGGTATISDALTAGNSIAIPRKDTGESQLSVRATGTQNSDMLQIYGLDEVISLSADVNGGVHAQNFSAGDVGENTGNEQIRVRRYQSDQSQDLTKWTDENDNVLAEVTASGALHDNAIGDINPGDGVTISSQNNGAGFSGDININTGPATTTRGGVYINADVVSLTGANGVAMFAPSYYFDGLSTSKMAWIDGSGNLKSTAITIANAGKSLSNAEFDAGTSGSAKTIDFDNGPLQKVTVSAAVTFTLSNPAVGTVYDLKLIQSGTGGWAYTWPMTVKWSGGVAPTGSATGKTDWVTLRWDGTSYYGTSALNY